MSRVALITGGSRGIGDAMISRFKGAGYRVAACSRTEIANPDADLAFRCDVADAGQVRSGLRRVLENLGRIDVLVNNAGVAGSNSLDPDAEDDLWHLIISVSLHGTYHMCKHALPLLPSGTGRIINVASVLALKGVPDQTAYCAAKHGVLGFTRALSHHAAHRRITVNAICPGWTRTEMAEGRMRELGLTEKGLEQGVPIGRFIEPSEVADLAVYLASEGAGGITGQALTIDGGALA